MNQHKFDHINDQELLERFQKTADNQWLGILLDRYSLLLFGVCMKYLKQEEEARDLVQQVFLKALHEMRKYDIHYPKSWLYKVAVNLCLMKLRGRKNEVQQPDINMEEPETNIQELRAREMDLQLLEESLQFLNPEQQTCVTLFYLQRKSYQEISEQTGYSLLQVKSHIQNGKRNLRILMEKKKSSQ